MSQWKLWYENWELRPSSATSLKSSGPLYAVRFMWLWWYSSAHTTTQYCRTIHICSWWSGDPCHSLQSQQHASSPQTWASKLQTLKSHTFNSSWLKLSAGWCAQWFTITTTGKAGHSIWVMAEVPFLLFWLEWNLWHREKNTNTCCCHMSAPSLTSDASEFFGLFVTRLLTLCL